MLGAVVLFRPIESCEGRGADARWSPFPVLLLLNPRYVPAPMLAYQAESGTSLRSTLAAHMLVGDLVSLAAIAAVAGALAVMARGQRGPRPAGWSKWIVQRVVMDGRRRVERRAPSSRPETEVRVSTTPGKTHFWTGVVQDEGRVTRCGLQVAGRGKTTTALGAVTCKRCVQYVELDRMVTRPVTKRSRRRRGGMY